MYVRTYTSTTNFTISSCRTVLCCGAWQDIGFYATDARIVEILYWLPQQG